jgi:hypothetical protein
MIEDVGDRDPLPADENEKVDDQHAKFGCNLITRANPRYCHFQVKYVPA